MKFLRTVCILPILLIQLLLSGCPAEHSSGHTQGDRNQFFDDLANSGYDLQIIDYSQNGDDGSAYTRGEVDLMKYRGNCLVVATLSLGVAESNRFYWRAEWDANRDGIPDSAAPSWLVREFSPGRWLVRYWDPAWKALIYGHTDSYLSRILQAGYSGVYLTGLDTSRQQIGVANANTLLKQAIVELCDSVHTWQPGMFVIGQNMGNLTTFPDLVERIDGAAQDAMFYGYNNGDGIAVPDQIRSQNYASLSLFTSPTKIMIAIDYPFQGSRDRAFYDTYSMPIISDGRNLARSLGLKYYPGVRNLDDVTIIPGAEPTANASPIYLLSQVNEVCVMLHPGPR